MELVGFNTKTPTPREICDGIKPLRAGQDALLGVTVAAAIYRSAMKTSRKLQMISGNLLLSWLIPHENNPTLNSVDEQITKRKSHFVCL